MQLQQRNRSTFARTLAATEQALADAGTRAKAAANTLATTVTKQEAAGTSKADG